MEIITIGNEIPHIEKNVCCIGYFDGVHLGHRALINKTLEIAQTKNLKACLMTFDPDPSHFLNPGGLHINSLTERYSLFSASGLNYVLSVAFSEDMLHQEPEDFIQQILLKCNIDTLICGFDFRFGFRGRGNTALLSEFKNFFNLEVIGEIEEDGQKISSTRIRNNLLNGNLKFANHLLGYQYFKYIKLKNAGESYQAKVASEDLLIPADGNYSGFIQDELSTFPVSIRIKNSCIYLASKTVLKLNYRYKLVFEDE